MNREDIIAMAREAGLPHLHPGEACIAELHELEHLVRAAYDAGAAAAKAEENEACAQFLESTQLGSLPDDTALHYARLLKGFAEGIRARKENT